MKKEHNRQRERDAFPEESDENGFMERIFASLSVILFAWEKYCCSWSGLKMLFVARQKKE